MFDSLSNGNCLYNSVGVALMLKHLEKSLDPVLNQPESARNFARLINGVLHSPLAEPITVDALKAGLDQILDKCRFNGEINWVNVQLMLAPQLRAMVVQEFETDPEIRQWLTSVLERCVDFSDEAHVNLGHCVDEIFLDFNIAPKLSELKTKHALEPDQQARFKALQSSSVQANKPLSKDEQLELEQLTQLHKSMLQNIKKELSEWFFSAEVWHDFLYGEKGVATNGVWAGEAHAQILAQLFSVNIMAANRKEESTHIRGFKEKDSVVKFALLIGDVHWQVRLPQNDETKSLLKRYYLQRQQYMKEQYQELFAVEKRRIKETYSSFKAHHEATMPDLSKEDYLKLYDLNEQQYLPTNQQTPTRRPSVELADQNDASAKEVSVGIAGKLLGMLAYYFLVEPEEETPSSPKSPDRLSPQKDPLPSGLYKRQRRTPRPEDLPPPKTRLTTTTAEDGASLRKRPVV